MLIGSITAFFGDGPEFTVSTHKRKGAEGNLTVLVSGSSNEYETGQISLSLQQLSGALKDLNQMWKESESSSDDLSYISDNNRFIVGLRGPESQLAISVESVMVITANKTKDENRQVLQQVISLLKRGQMVIQGNTK